MIACIGHKPSSLGVVFCELQLASHNCWFCWQCLWHWFLWLVFFGEFIWSFSGVFLYRSVWYHRTEVRIYLWLVVPRGGLIRQNSRQGGSVLHLPVYHLLCVGGALWNAWLDVSIDGNCLFGWFGSVSWRCSFCLWETHTSYLSLMKR